MEIHPPSEPIESGVEARWVSHMWNDLRFAFRVVMRSPGFTAVAVLSLALGIGANTAISSLIYQLAVRWLPVAEPKRLVALESDEYSFGWARCDNSTSVFSKPMYEALRNRAQVFGGLIARAAFPATLAYGWMLAGGIGVGLPASYALARLIESQLFGIRAHDPEVLIEGTLLMSLVAIGAGLIPGACAKRVEPVRALRDE